MRSIVPCRNNAERGHNGRKWLHESSAGGILCAGGAKPGNVPSISLSMFTMASIARFTRSEMIEVLDSDYMLLAESKGISGPALIFRHALRNALI